MNPERTAKFFIGEKQVQGAALSGSKAYFSSSAPAGSAGELLVTKTALNTTSTRGWVDSPEDLMIDHGAGTLWGLSEEEDHRFVFSISLP